MAAPSLDGWLSGLGSLRVLESEEVADLAKRLAAARATDDTTDPLPDDVTAAIVADGMRARELLIRHNLRLVPGMAARWQGHGLDLDALIQHGNLGLIAAVDRFDPARGYRFATYATWWIRQALQRAVATEARVVRVPEHHQLLARRSRRVALDLEVSLGRPPTSLELAGELEVTVEALERARSAMEPVVALDRPVGEGGATLADLIDDPTALDPDEVAARADLPAQVALLLARLPERDRGVLVALYGLDGAPARSDAQLAQVLGVSRASVQLIRARALQRLRHPANRARLAATVA